MSPRDWLAVFAIGLGTAVIPLDSAVNIAFPDITGSFGKEIQQIQWVIIAYVLTHTSLMLFCGRVGDRFGRRLVFSIGLGWSALAFIALALAPTFEWLLAARVAWANADADPFPISQTDAELPLRSRHQRCVWGRARSVYANEVGGEVVCGDDLDIAALGENRCARYMVTMRMGVYDRRDRQVAHLPEIG